MLALKGGHCSEMEERERELLEGPVYCENTKRSLSRSSATPRVKALHTQRSRRQYRPLQKPESLDTTLEMSSDIK